METTIIKGIIESCNYATKYDDDGIEYKLYWLTVSQQRYTAKIPKGIYLSEGMTVLLEIDNNLSKEVLSGYCIKEDYEWGENVRSLKKHLEAFDKYEFVTGRIIEKRKSSSQSFDFSKDTSNRGVSYTIVLKDRNFYASEVHAKRLKADMEIAVVLEQNEAVLILDKESGKITGLTKPYFILLLLMLISFNGAMFYLYQTHQTHLINYNMTLIVLNVFLVLFTALSMATYLFGRSAKQFLFSKIQA